MDKKKIKRVIAREGLIIIGCIFMSLVFMFLSGIVKFQSPAYRYMCSFGNHKYELESNSFEYIGEKIQKMRCLLA